MIFDINVNKLIVSCDLNRIIVSDSVGMWYAKINLDEDWDGMNCKILFYTKSAAKDVVITNEGVVTVPFEVLTPGAELKFTISGYSESGNQLHTKEMLSTIKIESAGKYMGDNPEAYTPELWEQVMALLNSGQSSNSIWKPTVSDNGDLTWEKSASDEAPASVNIKGPQGDSYVLTDADKNEIAKQVLSLIPNGDEVSY